MPKICQRYAQDMQYICSGYAQYMPKVCLSYVKNMPKICPIYAQDMHKICLGSFVIQRLSFLDYLPILRATSDDTDILNNWGTDKHTNRKITVGQLSGI